MPTPAPRDSARRNIWAVSLTSLLTDISSEMVLHLVPLYLSAVLGVGMHVIGLIEGVAKSVASLLKLVSGRLADRFRRRKWLAVAGYGISALSKPFFLWATTWQSVAAVRWVERVGKGVRTAPRDALLADSAPADRRGFVFGLHRAADTLGAVIGLGIAMAVISFMGTGSILDASTFHWVVLYSLVPALAAVAVLALGAKDITPSSKDPKPRSDLAFRALGKRFFIFLAIVALFDLGDSSDAFLVLRASERGLGVVGILSLLALFNIVYALISTPAGRLSDRFGRRRVLVIGWGVYALVYLGLARVQSEQHLWPLFALYGVYYGLTHGTAKAFVADLVPEDLRGTAFGTYHALIGFLDLPASVVAGLLWQGFGPFQGSAAAPFYFSAATAGCAALALLAWRRFDRSAI